MDPIYVIPGDVFFTHSTSLLGRLIRWAETDPKERPAWANHVGVVTGYGWLVPPAPAAAPSCSPSTWARVVEALWKVENWPWYEGHRAEIGNEVRVYRRRRLLTVGEERVFVSKANSFTGDRYGWWKLLFHLADRVAFKGDKVLSRLLGLEGRPICSFLAAHCFDAIGYSFGMDPDVADPDEMMDFCECSDEWTLVGSSKIEEVK